MDKMPKDSELDTKHDFLRANNMPYEAFEKASDDHHFKRREFFSKLQIPDVDEESFKTMALYAAMNGYSVDDFAELVEEKVFYKFAAAIKDVNPQEYKKYYG